MTADAFLRYAPTTIFVVPLTSTRRAFASHVAIEPDVANGLDATRTALVEQMRAVATGRCTDVIGSIGPSVRAQLLEVLAMLTGMS